jgi:hypothetical protein
MKSAVKCPNMGDLISVFLSTIRAEILLKFYRIVPKKLSYYFEEILVAERSRVKYVAMSLLHNITNRTITESYIWVMSKEKNDCTTQISLEDMLIQSSFRACKTHSAVCATQRPLVRFITATLHLSTAGTSIALTVKTNASASQS